MIRLFRVIHLKFFLFGRSSEKVGYLLPPLGSTLCFSLSFNSTIYGLVKIGGSIFWGTAIYGFELQGDTSLSEFNNLEPGGWMVSVLGREWLQCWVEDR